MKDNYLPELHKPMMDLTTGNNAGLPALVNKLFPATTKKVTPNDGAISLVLDSWKIKKVAECAEGEKRIAQANRDALVAVLDGFHAFVTSSARIADTLMDFEHKKNMRFIEFDKGKAELELLKLEAKEKEADIYIKQAQAQQAGYEAKLTELDYNVRLKQYKEMGGDE